MTRVLQRAHARLGLNRIQWKLFGLISAAVALPVVILVIYFSTAQVRMVGDMLTSKASSLSAVLTEQLRLAIAFDDVQTARESFASAALDADVAFLALFRGNGRLLYSVGEVAPMPTLGTDDVRSYEDETHIVRASRVRSAEGPTGVLVLGLSKARAAAAGSDVNRAALVMGLGMVLLGCAAAWAVGSSLARRIKRVKVRAEQVAAGDLSEAPLSDRSKDELGQMARAFHVMVGVVERKVAERTAELAASREQLQRLLESTEAIPWQFDPVAQTILYLGPQAAHTFGAPLEALHDFGYWRTHIKSEDFERALGALGTAVSRRADVDLELGVTRDDGRQLTIRSMMSVAADASRPLVMGFMFDVTEQRKLELDLRQAQKLESVGRLAAGVAHEINTPIQFVRDSVHFLRDALTDVCGLVERYRALHDELRVQGLGARVEALEEAAEDADLDYALEHAPKAAERSLDGLDRVATIVRAMKEFAHPEQVDKVPADLNASLSATLTIASSEYRHVADVVADYGPLPSVTCHVGELNQAFLNIIVNAAHAIADHRKDGTAKGRITIATAVDGDEVVIRIGDTGGGIPEAVRARIFEPFFTTKDVGRGTGQGLAIARSVVVDKHGGQLTFESEIGRGTTFEVRLPTGRREALALAA